MALKWTQVTAVRAHLDSYDTLSISDAKVEAILLDCEAYVRELVHVDEAAGTDFFNNYVEDKHRLVKECAEVRAAMIVLAAISLSPNPLQQAALTMDFLSYLLEGDLKMLADQNVTTLMLER